MEEDLYLNVALRKCSEIQSDIQSTLFHIARLNARYALTYPYSSDNFSKATTDLNNLSIIKMDLNNNQRSSSSSGSSCSSSLSSLNSFVVFGEIENNKYSQNGHSFVDGDRSEIYAMRKTSEVIRESNKLCTKTIKIKRSFENSLSSLDHKMKLYDIIKQWFFFLRCKNCLVLGNSCDLHGCWMNLNIFYFTWFFVIFSYLIAFKFPTWCKRAQEIIICILFEFNHFRFVK